MAAFYLDDHALWPFVFEFLAPQKTIPSVVELDHFKDWVISVKDHFGTCSRISTWFKNECWTSSNTMRLINWSCREEFARSERLSYDRNGSVIKEREIEYNTAIAQAVAGDTMAWLRSGYASGSDSDTENPIGQLYQNESEPEYHTGPGPIPYQNRDWPDDDDGRHWNSFRSSLWHYDDWDAVGHGEWESASSGGPDR